MPRILLAGVAVLDFIFHMQEFPRTAEKYRADGAAISGGGNAANSAVAIARLGGEAMLAARIGDDAVAAFIEEGLREENVNTDLVKRFPDCRSSFSSIYIDASGERQIMNYRDMEISMQADWLQAAMPQDLNACMGDTRWPDGARVAMETAKQRGIPGVIDAEAPVMEAKVAVECASHVAFSAQGARDFTQVDDLEKAALNADEKLQGTIIITDGGADVLLVKDRKIHRIPCFPIAPIDTLGAGDIWHGAFTLTLALGKEEEPAIRFANAAAALKCSTSGGRNAAPTAKQVSHFLEQNS